MNRFEKASWILKNEGPIKLGKKSVKYGLSKLPKKTKKLQLSEAYNYLANPIFSITEEDILASQITSSKKIKGISTALWFVPYFDHITFGGIYTIFRFIEHIAKQGVKTYVVIYDNKYLDPASVKAQIVEHFPDLESVELIIFDPESRSVDDLPESDISFSTIWMSAYFHLKYNQTKRKYYFIQDYEPLFYEGGSMYALAESTYRFGFTGVVNTPGLLKAVNQRHDLNGVSFVPAVDKRYYYPDSRQANKMVRIFFYARPGNPRNAFELGVLIIQKLIQEYGDKIEVVTAGSNWDESEYGLDGLITNLGLLNSLQDVGNLYRSCDIGFVFMLSKHPSYQPFEFMASGMATVTNRNEDNLWLFQDGKNCLLAEPSPGAMAEKIGILIEDEKLRKAIAETGQKNINYSWQTELDKIWAYIQKN
jgi:glycosyltransferase involved in cell wall biosynthesis